MARALDRTLQQILCSADLPSLPAAASRILELTSLADVSFVEVADLITQDIGLSAKILKVANSAFYNFSHQIGSVQQAFSLLGMKAVRSLVLSFSFLTVEQKKSSPHFNYNTFWEQALITAVSARLIAEQTGLIDPEEMFTLGLLQNVGQLVFALTLPARYDHVLQHRHNGNQQSDVVLEEEFCGLSHCLSGAEVARVWGLPESIITTIKYHHTPLQYKGENPHHALSIKIAYLSELVTQIFHSKAPLIAQEEFEKKAGLFLNLTPLEINTTFRRLNKEIEKASRLFGVNINPVRPVSEIIQEANIRLSLLNYSYKEMNRELKQAKIALEELRSQLAERNRHLERLANLDGLTEIHNHRFFQSFLRTEIKRASRTQRPISLLLADIDHFKRFNDCHGHQNGDFILKELCRVVRAILRKYDLMARYGGEEFAFVLPETDEARAGVVAEKIRSTVEEHDFFDGRHHYRVTLSIGATTARFAENGLCPNELIAQADQALYQAKNHGRNQVTLFRNPLQPKWRQL